MNYNKARPYVCTITEVASVAKNIVIEVEAGCASTSAELAVVQFLRNYRQEEITHIIGTSWHCLVDVTYLGVPSGKFRVKVITLSSDKTWFCRAESTRT